MARRNAATLALRMLLDAFNDENDEELQESLDKLSDEVERGHWPDARAAAKEFLGADGEDATAAPVVEDNGDDHHADDWNDDP